MRASSHSKRIWRMRNRGGAGPMVVAEESRLVDIAMPKKKVTFDIKQWLKEVLLDAQKELKKAKKARAVPMKLASRRDIDALYYNVDLERDLRKVVDTLTELSKCMISPHSVSKE